MTDESSPKLPAPSKSRRVRWLNTCWTLAVIAIWLKVAINLTVRDRFPIVAMVYYAIPPILLAIGAVVLACIGRWLNKSRMATLPLIVLALTAAMLWVRADFRREGVIRANNQKSLRIVFWNVGRGWYGKPQLFTEQLKQFDADVLAMVEATAEEMESAKYWRQSLPDYVPLRLDDGIVVLVRGEAKLESKGSLTHWGQFRRLQVRVRDVPFELIVGDIVSDPWLPRLPALADLWQVMTKQATRPTLVVGDFNTPPSSVAFDHWHREWSRAWDVAGAGYQPTWPQPFPVLALDHVWGNQGIAFHRAIGGWSNCSDHRPVIVDFSVTPN